MDRFDAAILAIFAGWAGAGFLMYRFRSSRWYAQHLHPLLIVKPREPFSGPARVLHILIGIGGGIVILSLLALRTR
jgi:sterol desaturase/sphingolipid hydroxylase (fatty acid hydroxylase superfamily)